MNLNFQNTIDFSDKDALEMNNLVSDQFLNQKPNGSITSEMPQSIFFENLSNGISKMTKQTKTS